MFVRVILVRWPGEARRTCVEVVSMCCAGPGGACGMKHATRMAMTWHAMKNPDKRGVQRHHGSDPADMPATSCVCENSERFKHKHGQKRHVTFFGLFKSLGPFVYLGPQKWPKSGKNEPKKYCGEAGCPRAGGAGNFF